MSELKYLMTNEIAFELGQRKFRNFYGMPLWKINKEPFPLISFIKWSGPGLFGFPLDSFGNIDWDNFNVYGQIDWTKFETENIKDSISYKLSFIKGYCAHDKWSLKINGDNEIVISWANAQNECMIVKKWIEEIIQHYFPNDNYDIQYKHIDSLPSLNSLTLSSENANIIKLFL